MSDMLQISRILVPIDGSEYSRHAGRDAIRIAQTFASEVVFLHVVSDIVLAELAQRESGDGERVARQRLADQGQAHLNDVARLAGEAGVAHREILGNGDPCAVICETAASLPVDLIVMGKIGRHGARRILMGSVARRVIESSDRPVLVVGAPEASC
jgi:nucleotide-binding universal stress UspA family protein